jgi:UDP-N-acetylmuramoylalanine-D-glutamate ligase
LLKDAIRLSQRKVHLSAQQYDNRKNRLYHRLEQILWVHHYDDKDIKRLLKRLRRHKSELFTFLEHENVSPFNNHAEQQIRKPVLTRKVSQQNRSEPGAKTQAILMSLFRSAELQGQNPIEVVLCLAKSSLTHSAVNEESLKVAA